VRALARPLAVCLALLCAGNAAQAKWGVQVGQWETQQGTPCAAAVNIIDSDNSRPFVLGISGGTLVVASPVAEVAKASVLAVDSNTTASFACAKPTRCEADAGTSSLMQRLMTGGTAARLELTLANGQTSGPYEIPLDGLKAALEGCGVTEPPIDRRLLNPEPQVAPAPLH
jgi:hypothetical protein